MVVDADTDKIVGCTLFGPESVSYTHLDVYKRQGRYFMVAQGKEVTDAVDGRHCVIVRRKHDERDVYKRQEWGCGGVYGAS